MKQRYREHRPPRDIFASGSLLSLAFAVTGYMLFFGFSAGASAAANRRVATLYENFTRGTESHRLIESIGAPTSRSPIGKFDLLRFESPKGFDYEIDALVIGDKIQRIFTIESEAHREALETQIAKYRK